MTTDAELRALYAAATPGEWEAYEPRYSMFNYVDIETKERDKNGEATHIAAQVAEHNAALIVALHNEAPRLLDENARLRAAMECEPCRVNHERRHEICPDCKHIGESHVWIDGEMVSCSACERTAAFAEDAL